MSSKKDFSNNLAQRSDPRTLVASKDKPTTRATTKATKSKAKGRPLKDESKGKKRDYCKTINIAVPKEVLEEVSGLATAARGMNLTDYVNLLIKNDLDKNRAKYRKNLSQKDDFD